MIFLLPVIAGLVTTTITISGGLSAAACGAISAGLAAGITKVLVDKHKEKKKKDAEQT
ncbi:MAG: hypothetical protein K5751_04230 [Treponemataceae bacterium]|nr:hypothetical protein [Treponemataceae bacterium]